MLLNKNISIKFLFLSTMILFGCQPSLPDDVAAAYQELPEEIDFNFHIRPLLADRCFACHGPDEQTREAGLRLDEETSAFAKLNESRGRAFVKGSIRKSVAWERIISDDPNHQMPPPESHLNLSAKEKALITKWIEQGAKWKKHWAFIPPEKSEIPTIIDKAVQVHNSIDNFILAKLEEHDISPSSEADKERLIRRLSFDLTGLPPKLDEIDEFLADDSPEAYENLVDRLLSSDAHAERMAMEWLDVARFGDTQGMHTDAERFNWPWRDWVIKAFKENLPYDDFITWQMAGDLLPNPTREQKLATVFHRNHPTTSEGGIVEEEFRQKYVQDRTNTTATAFLGLTMECATCHDHKFDPISQKEYYQMSAFFNNLNEIGMLPEYGIPSGPVLLLPEPEADSLLIRLEESIGNIRKQRALTHAEVAQSKEFLESLERTSVMAPKPDKSFPFESLAPYKNIKRGVIHRSHSNRPIDKMADKNPNSMACGDLEVVKGKKGNAFRSPNDIDIVFLKEAGSFEINEPYSAGAWIFTEKEGENQTIMGTSGEMGNAWRGWDFFLDSMNRTSITFISSRPHNMFRITAKTSIPKEEWHHAFFTYDGSATANGIQLFIDGKKVESTISYDHLYRSIIRKWSKRSKEWPDRPVMVFRSGRFHLGENGVFKGSIDEIDIFNQCLSPLEVAVLYDQEISTNSDLSTLNKENHLTHYLNRNHSAFQNQTQKLQELIGEKLKVLEDVPEIMAMADMANPRKTYILDRGQYDAPTEEVQAGTPEKVLSFSSELPQNRLGLAKWLIDPQNPLTARVVVNRYWQMIFGRGIVETPHDFGIQGALPSHPELLDYLAIRFIESGWNVRELLKMMVLSATYRQSSSPRHEQLNKDPKNIFLARGSSYRLQAEMIRDNALAASGLLNATIGGMSVKPYQPDNIWDFGSLVTGNYEVEKGPDLYRRSLYTYIRRTSPHPTMTIFDAPSRSVCTVKRENTNTPLQALVLLNDPQFVEAARVLAERMQKEGGNNWAEQTQYGFRLLCGRQPNDLEMELMKAQFEFAQERFRKNADAASKLLSIGDHPIDLNLDKIHTASLTMVANTVMNFDEAYMRR